MKKFVALFVAIVVGTIAVMAVNAKTGKYYYRNAKVYKVFNDIRNAKEYVYKKYDGCIEKDFTQLNNNTHEAILDDGDIIRIYTRHLE